MELNENITILERRDETTVITTVEMVINGETLTLDIPHFMPQSEDDIILGLNNRYANLVQQL